MNAKKTFKQSSAEIAQLGERQTEDLKVPGSNNWNICMCSELSRVSALTF